VTAHVKTYRPLRVQVPQPNVAWPNRSWQRPARATQAIRCDHERQHRTGGALIEGFTQRKLPDRSAWLISTIAHWAYGSAAGAAYGILAGSLPTPHPRYGVPFGAAVFANEYIALPVAGLYKPIWEYDAKTLAGTSAPTSPAARAPEPRSGC